MGHPSPPIHCQPVEGSSLQRRLEPRGGAGVPPLLRERPTRQRRVRARRRSSVLVRKSPRTRLAHNTQVLAPVRLPLRAFQRVARSKELLNVFRRLEQLDALARFQALAGSSPQPRAQGHPLPTRLTDETVSVLIRDYKLDPSHPDLQHSPQAMCIVQHLASRQVNHRRPIPLVVSLSNHEPLETSSFLRRQEPRPRLNARQSSAADP